MELLKPPKQSFFVLFFIQRNKVRSNGRVPIMARITVNGEKTHFSTKFDVLPERWTVQDHRTIGATKEEREINDTLEELRSMIKRRYYEFVSNGQAISAIILKNSVFSVGNRCVTLLPLCTKFIKDYYSLAATQSVKMDTYQRYVYTRRRLAEYMINRYNLKDISIFDITYDFIKGFDIWLRIDCGIGSNTAAKLVKHFRTMFNVAINNGWIHSDPFSSYKIQFEKADRGYLTHEELMKFMSKPLESAQQTLVRDMFLFSTFTGLSYTDVSELSKENIEVDSDGRQRIVTQRHKTGIRVTIPLLDLPKSIIEKYEGAKRRVSQQNRLLPIYSNHKCNQLLGEIARECGINKRLTYHLSRHTFATTVALANGMPIETVSRLLGHTSIKTTQIYARITDTKVGRDMDILAQRLDLDNGMLNTVL